MGKRLKNPPRLFHVNWFRRDAAGKFLWPGFGDNLRVMEWILKRCTGAGRRATNRRSAICRDPADLNLKGADVSEATMQELLAVHARRLAQGSRRNARVPEGIRRARAGGDVRRARRDRKTPGLKIEQNGRS